MIDPKQRSCFPDSFLWGASVSSHQVEGGNHNQWTMWEHETAARLASEAHKKYADLAIWDAIKAEAESPLNYISGRCIDHFKKYKLDFELARSLNLNAMRGGVEWSRINPKEGVFDPAAIEYYSKYFRTMKKQGLEPLVNLFHWTLPVWFAQKGGFKKSSNLTYWRDFIHTLVQNFDFSGVKYVITINEANSYAAWSYALGGFPPGEKNVIANLRVYRNLAKAHRIAYKIIKAKYPDVQVGVAHQFEKCVGIGMLGKVAARLEAWYANWWWMRMAKYHDFIGFNYYFADYRKKLSLLPDANPKEPLNDLGWYMEPSGIEWVLNEIGKKWPGKPIIIAENGVADMQDQYREWWIAETISAMSRSIKAGVNLVGYVHWSLLDNFEWQYGWFPKFGLISVDRKTMKRTVRESAKAWGRWLRLDH